jgi:hypothetical protein
MKPRPLHLVVCSGSDATLDFLGNMLEGFRVKQSCSMSEAQSYLESLSPSERPVDFVILDDQSEAHADDMARFIRSLPAPTLRETRVLHLYTPTTMGLGDIFSSRSILGVVKMTKPPRKARMLQLLAGLKDLPHEVSTQTSVQAARVMEEQAAAQRTLYGNVLVAEDNPIAQNLLVKQLERYQLKVTATSNGEEATAAWESHEPGYFSVALFDHRASMLLSRWGVGQNADPLCRHAYMRRSGSLKTNPVAGAEAQSTLHTSE